MAVESLRPRKTPVSYAEIPIDHDLLMEDNTNKQTTTSDQTQQDQSLAPPPLPFQYDTSVPSDDNYEPREVSSSDESDEAFEDAQQHPQATAHGKSTAKGPLPDQEQLDDDSEDQRTASSGSSNSNRRTQDRIRREGIDWSNPAKNLMIAKLLREAFLSVPNFRLMSHTFQELAEVMNRHFPNERVLVNGAAVRYKRDDLRKSYQVLMDLKSMEIANWDEEKFQVSFTDDQWNIIAHFMLNSDTCRPKFSLLARLRYRDSNPDLKLFKGIYDYKVRQMKKPEHAERTVPTTEEIRQAEEKLKEHPLENLFKRVLKDDKQPSATRASPKRQRLLAKEEKKSQLNKEVGERRQKFEDVALDPEILALQKGTTTHPVMPATIEESTYITPSQETANNDSNSNSNDRISHTDPVQNPYKDEDAYDHSHYHHSENPQNSLNHVDSQEETVDDEPPSKKRKVVRFADDNEGARNDHHKSAPEVQVAPKSILKDKSRQDTIQKNRIEVRTVELTAEHLLGERERERQEKAKREKDDIHERDETIEQIYLRVEELYSDRLIGSSLYRQFLAIDALDVYAFLRYKFRLNARSVAMCVQVLVEISQGEE